jgi:hypothetical protein
VRLQNGTEHARWHSTLERGLPPVSKSSVADGMPLDRGESGVKNCRMNWTIQKPTRDGWYWIRNAASEGWETIVEPQVVHVYGFDDGTPTVSFRPMKCAQTSQR